MRLRINILEINEIITFVDIIWNGPSPNVGDKIFLPQFINYSSLNIFSVNSSIATKEIIQHQINDNEVIEISKIEYITLDGAPMWGLCNDGLIAVWDIR